MLHTEQPDVVPVLWDGEAHMEPSARVRILLEQLVGSCTVQAASGTDPELAADTGVHEAAINVGELGDLLGLGGIDQRDAVLIVGEVRTGDQVVVVVLPAGRVDLVCDVGIHGHRVDVAGERECPQVRPCGCRAVEQPCALVCSPKDRRRGVPRLPRLRGRQRAVSEPFLSGTNLDLETGGLVLEPTSRRAVVDPVRSGLPPRRLHIQPVTDARCRLRALARQHDAVRTVSRGGV